MSAGQLLRYVKVQPRPALHELDLGARRLLAVLGMTISDDLFFFYILSRYNVHVLPLWLFIIITVCN